MYLTNYRSLTTQPNSYYNPTVRRVLGPALCAEPDCHGRLVTRGYNGNLESRRCETCDTANTYDANRPWNNTALKGAI